MVYPKEIFDDPEQHWAHITIDSDDKLEGQFFDRKEAGRPGQNGRVDKKDVDGLRKHIKQTISAFANQNNKGGLLILGIANNGEVKGTLHLSEDQTNSLLDFNSLAKGHATQSKYVPCMNSQGQGDRIILIYVPYSPKEICESLDKDPRAWHRSGSQNLPMNDQLREQLKRDKKIVEFERAYRCEFHIDDVDRHVLQEFRKVFQGGEAYGFTDERLLFEAGAIDRDEHGRLMFNNAGYLFFASNPQRLMDWAYIRLLRFLVDKEEAHIRGVQTSEKKFDGALPQQIRKMRTYFRESGFFKVYQKRSPVGGFIDDPEFPFIAIDEAIVNAVVHRDYGTQLPVESIHYKDAFVVTNPGRILQRGHDLPETFTLNDTDLSHMPRNSKLLEWLKMMRDEDGTEFVKAISEGTKRMRKAMAEAGLDAPQYHTDHFQTELTLFSNAAEREEQYRAISITRSSTEYTNLFPLKFLTISGHQGMEALVSQEQRQEFMKYLRDALRSKGWYVDRFGYSKLTAHHQGDTFDLPSSVHSLVHFYPAYVMQLKEYWSRSYLCIDYTLEVKNVRTLEYLLGLLPQDSLEDLTGIAKIGDWLLGKIVSIEAGFALFYFFDLDQEQQVPLGDIIPNLPLARIKQLLELSGVQFDLAKQVKHYSLSSAPDIARERAEKTLLVADELATLVFPLISNNWRATLRATPEPLFRGYHAGRLEVKSLAEPTVEFARGRETSDIRAGITKFGAYATALKTIELVPICTTTLRNQMETLIHRLREGKYRYSGSVGTFGAEIIYSSVITVSKPEDILQVCRQLLVEHPDWIANPKIDRVFLVHTPEKSYATDDENSPYYRVKRFLLEQGIPCQMVNTPTLLNPDWKDLNLALNIMAKSGVTPWVLPDRIPDADFFIGLSYTQTHSRSLTTTPRRLLGYATVFNSFGHWEFYSGNTGTFVYDERDQYFATLTKNTLERLSLPESPSIYFHYSARFSAQSRKAITQAARSVRPNGTYSFVSLNPYHNVRLYDGREETDGSLGRGSYVATGPNQVLISLTGYNPYRKTLGTPLPLEATIWTSRPPGSPATDADLKSLATQILSLTKLNWASTDSLCGEPITTKFAGDIAYLTDAFLRQAGAFRLHPILESTPWFL